jgi:type I restriction enzyme S subunit
MSELDGAYISDTPRKLTRAGLENCAATILPAGSVLFSSRAPIGHVAVNTVPMATNQGFKSFVPKPNCVVAKFLYWWLRTNRPYLESLGNGATFKEVSKAVVSRIEISLPPLAEQRRIAEVLDRAEALRAKRRAALAQLDSLIQSLFLDLFGDPATNPKGLAKETLEQLTLNITDGKHGDCRPSPDSGYFFVSVKDIKDGQIDYREARQIDRDDFMEVHRRTKLEVGDVLITNSGTIGRTAVIAATPELERTTFQKSVAIVKPRSERLESTYLKAALDMCVAKLSRESSGSSQKNLLLGQLRNFSVCVPPIPLQREFARRATAVEVLKTAQRASLAELDALFATLQHRAFRGEL